MTATEPTRRSDKSATDDDAQTTTTRRAFLGAAAAAATLAGSTTAAGAVTDDHGDDDRDDLAYPMQRVDEAAAERGAPMLDSRHPTLDELAEYLGVPVSDLAVLSLAGRFRGEEIGDDPHLAFGAAQGLHEIAGDLEATGVDLARERANE